MMPEWVISSSVLTLAVIALRYILKGKISLRLQYALWALVLVRLLVPVSFGASGLSILNVTQRSERYADAAAALDASELPYGTLADTPLSRGEAEAAHGGTVYKIQGHSVESGQSELHTYFFKAPARTVIDRSLKALWLSGAAVLGLTLLVSNLHFAARLKKSRRRIEGLPCPLHVYVSPETDTPCLFGLLRPAVYLTPDACAEETEMRHIVTHELAHYRHLDHIWPLFRCVCLCVHWYNPLVWWAAMLSRRDAELACDEATVRRLGESERAEYGRTLIRMTCEKRAALLLTATAMTGSKGSIRERIVLLAKKPKTKAVTLAAVLLLTAVAAGCTFTGAKAESGGADGPVSETAEIGSAFTPDTVSMVQMLSSVMPPEPITDPDTVSYLWGLYQSFTFDGTAEKLDQKNVWSISVTFRDSATGKSESFAIHKGGLCVLDGDYETYHVLAGGEAIYDAFLCCFKGEKPPRTNADAEGRTADFPLVGFSASAEGSDAEIGQQWAEAYASQYMDAAPENPLLSADAAVLRCVLTAESLLNTPKTLVYEMRFAFDALDANAFLLRYAGLAEALPSSAYPAYAGWMSFVRYVTLEDAGDGVWRCTDAGTGGSGGWGYLDYEVGSAANAYIESTLRAGDVPPENLLLALPFVNWTSFDSRSWNALYACIDEACLTGGRVYGPEDGRLWQDVYPDDQAYRDLYVMHAALHADGAYSEGLAGLLQKQQRYDPALFEQCLQNLTEAQRSAVTALVTYG